jgi:hypothetical protein
MTDTVIAYGPAPHVLADLAEEFTVIVESRGVRAADRWYTAQVIRSVIPFLGHRLSRRLSTVLAPETSMDVRSDLRGALRQLRRSPATSAAAMTPQPSPTSTAWWSGCAPCRARGTPVPRTPWTRRYSRSPTA